MKMKVLRKWSRILHRDIGYFFIGTTLIYAISGIALNHMSDWNPNYSVELKNFNTNLKLNNSLDIKETILLLLDDIDNRNNYKKHYYPNNNRLKIFLKGGSSIVVNIRNGKGTVEYLKKRPLFFETHSLHYNPSSIVYSKNGSSIKSLFMVKGKKGIFGRGGIYTILGFVIPILFLILFI